MSAQFLTVAASGLILGLLFGSFLAALVMRWPQGRSVLGGRSACDGCRRTLRVTELIPLLGALASSGRCRTCGTPIDPVHWWMEAGCGAIGLAATLVAPIPAALGWMVLGWVLLTLAVLDARHFWLPDALTLPLAGLGLMVAPWITGVTIVDAAIGAAVGYAALLVIALAYRRLRGRDGLGLGDAKLLGAIGAWFGWQALPFVLLAASVTGLVWALAIAARKGGRVDAEARVPLGTFLCAAAIPGAIAARGLLFG